MAHILTFYLTFFLAFYLAFILTFFLAFFLALCLIAFYLAFHLAFYLASILTFYLTFFLQYALTFYLASILSFDLTFFLAFYLASILTFYLAFILAFFLASILTFSDILSGILSGIYSDVLSGILCDILSGIWLRSSSAHWDLAPAVGSGSAHWDLEFVVEVWQSPLRFGARGLGPATSGANSWGPAVPAQIWSSLLGEGGRKEGRKEGRREATPIKSRGLTWQLGNNSIDFVLRNSIASVTSALPILYRRHHCKICDVWLILPSCAWVIRPSGTQTWLAEKSTSSSSIILTATKFYNPPQFLRLYNMICLWKVVIFQSALVVNWRVWQAVCLSMPFLVRRGARARRPRPWFMWERSLILGPTIAHCAIYPPGNFLIN